MMAAIQTGRELNVATRCMYLFSDGNDFIACKVREEFKANPAYPQMKKHAQLVMQRILTRSLAELDDIKSVY